jgi:hypothetical protein
MKEKLDIVRVEVIADLPAGKLYTNRLTSSWMNEIS